MALLETFIAFTRNMNAVEKTLRFLQASFAIATVLAPQAYRVRAAQTKLNINQSRRFFRVFMWMECWSTVTRSDSVGALRETLFKLGNVTLGMYLFLDMLILPFALGALDETYCNVWIQRLTEIEGVDVGVIERVSFVCWYFATLLFASLLVLEIMSPTRSVKQHMGVPGGAQRAPRDAIARQPQPPAHRLDSRRPKFRVVRRLSCSISDILVSGTAAGYIKLQPLYVAIAMAASSVLSMHEIWMEIHTEKGVSQVR